jgi:streptogramin lyase
MSLRSASALKLSYRRSLFSLLLFFISVIASAQVVTIQEYPLAYNTGPGDIAAGPDDYLWISGGGSLGKIVRMKTDGTAITEYPLPSCCAPGQITVGPDGALWFTKPYSNQIGRITVSGAIQEYSLPVSMPYVASYPQDIVAGPDGALWFTEFTGNKIGRITTSGQITEYSLPHDNSYPFFITVGPDDALWFTEFGSTPAIGRITTDGLIKEYLLPYNHAAIGITAGPDGRLWYADYSANSIGAITTTGTMSEYPVKFSGPWPNLLAITAGPDGALWFTEADVDRIGRITTGGVISEYSVPTAHSLPTEIGVGPDGAIWFTEAKADKVARIQFATDTIAPAVTLSITPSSLWPPNGQMVRVLLSGRVSDADSGVLPSSIEFAVFDEYGTRQPGGHITVDGSGNYRFAVLLQASRKNNDLDGRQYMIRISARDNAGNLAVKWASVLVPHDRR